MNSPMRARTTRSPKAQAEDSFVEGFEQPKSSEMSVEERVEKRQTSGRYFAGLVFRTTEEQKELLQFAAAKRNLSMQKLVENIVMQDIEEEFGEDFDALKS